MTSILQDLGIDIPIVQAPMAGTSNPALAAAVCEAGALGSIAIGATDAASAREMIASLKSATLRPFNVNLFCHAPARHDAERETAWLKRLAPVFAQYDAEPPQTLSEIYTSFLADDAMLEVLLETRPKVVSFHFGLPGPDRIAALKETGTVLMATATQPHEARTIAEAGIDVIVAQGIEAGGHRGIFDPAARDERLETLTLTRLIRREAALPVIAAGGIMDGTDIAAALESGAIAAQLGTAFIACPESSADDAYCVALLSSPAKHTQMTAAISGRPARCLANRFTQLADELADMPPPDYPIAYDAGKALASAAREKGESGFGAQWAGQGAPRARAMPARLLVETLHRELAAAQENAMAT